MARFPKGVGLSGWGSSSAAKGRARRPAGPVASGSGRRIAGRILRWALLLPLVALGLILAVAVAGLAVTPPSTLMLWRWVTLRPVERQVVPIARVSPNLVNAIVAAEDGRYCAHRGVDWDALRAVVEEADEEGPARGASTVAMQTAKNVFLWHGGAYGLSYLRKGLEIPLALGLDALWGKTRLMEVYLNVAEWGDGVFGAEAAARKHFNKSAADLTPREAALLAAALPLPRMRDPRRPTGRFARLAGVVQRRAAGAGPVTCVARPGRA